MAASDARPLPRKNTAFRVTFPIYNSSGDLVAGASGLDSEVSIDGGTFADCTNEATEIATSSGIYYLDLTAGELNGDTIAINIKSTSNKTTTIVIYPEELGDIRVDVGQISGDATAADNAEAFFDGTGYAGTNNVIPTVTTATNVTTVNGLASGVITASAIAADAITDAKVASDVTIASVTGAVGSVTGNVGGNVVGSVASVTAGVSIADGAITAAKFGAVAITAAVIATDAIDADALAADAVTELQSGLLTTSAFNTKLGTPAGASVSADIAAVKAETASIQSDTNDLQTQIGTAGAGLTAVASAANLATLTGYVDTEVAAIKAKTDNLPASPAATGDIPSASSIAAAVWAYVVEGAYTAVQVYRIIAAVLAGESTGGGTTSVAFRDIADSKNRVSATVDGDGNRTAVTLDGS